MLSLRIIANATEGKILFAKNLEAIDVGSMTEYTEPIEITNTTLVRAMAILKFGEYSQLCSRCFIKLNSTFQDLQVSAGNSTVVIETFGQNVHTDDEVYRNVFVVVMKSRNGMSVLRSCTSSHV
jgi:hypothetical protein